VQGIPDAGIGLLALEPGNILKLDISYFRQSQRPTVTAAIFVKGTGFDGREKSGC